MRTKQSPWKMTEQFSSARKVCHVAGPFGSDGRIALDKVNPLTRINFITMVQSTFIHYFFLRRDYVPAPSLTFLSFSAIVVQSMTDDTKNSHIFSNSGMYAKRHALLGRESVHFHMVKIIWRREGLYIVPFSYMGTYKKYVSVDSMAGVSEVWGKDILLWVAAAATE